MVQGLADDHLGVWSRGQVQWADTQKKSMIRFTLYEHLSAIWRNDWRKAGRKPRGQLGGWQLCEERRAGRNRRARADGEQRTDVKESLKLGPWLDVAPQGQ